MSGRVCLVGSGSVFGKIFTVIENVAASRSAPGRGDAVVNTATGCFVRWVRVPEGDVSVCVGSVCDSGVICVCCLVSVWNVLSECT